MKDHINPFSVIKSDLCDGLRNHVFDFKELDLISCSNVNKKRHDLFSFVLEDIIVDISRQKVNETTLNLLHAYANAKNVQSKMTSMFLGENINFTEKKPVSHTMLRACCDDKLIDRKAFDKIEIEKNRFCIEAEAIRSGLKKGVGGLYESIIHVGIGGSELGPRLLLESLEYLHDGPSVKFLSNIDPVHFEAVVKDLNPAKTLIIGVSKSFSTPETLKNLNFLKAWFVENNLSSDDFNSQFVAITTNKSNAIKFGAREENIFLIPNGVGGRFSFCSSVSFSVAIAIGVPNFKRILQGARKVDLHVLNETNEKNIPLNLALLDFWNLHGLGMKNRAVIPYTNLLKSYVEYIQQLEMESNGKSTDVNGNPLLEQSCPIVWGCCGTNAQHAFFQMIHQGSEIIPVEFLVFVDSPAGKLQMQKDLLANVIAQSEALLVGRKEKDVKEILQKEGCDKDSLDLLLPHRTFSGNRPSTIFLLKSLSPGIIGSLLALAEHRATYFGWLLGINSFDQWGVELGKILANVVSKDLSTENNSKHFLNHDLLTASTISYVRKIVQRD